MSIAVRFYSNSSDPKKVGKSLSSLGSATCNLKHDSDVLQPTIEVAKSAISNWSRVNYMYIPDYGRYYFITGNISETAGIMTVHGRVDVLQTYSSGIRNVTCEIERQENNYNKYYQDEFCPVRTTKTYIYKTLGNLPRASSIILTVDGGKNV